jgi:hypothetical protein
MGPIAPGARWSRSEWRQTRTRFARWASAAGCAEAGAGRAASLVAARLVSRALSSLRPPPVPGAGQVPEIETILPEGFGPSTVVGRQVATD